MKMACANELIRVKKNIIKAKQVTNIEFADLEENVKSDRFVT